MERNPYAPPKANVADAAADAAVTPVSGGLYTPGQHFVAAFIGSPIAAAWLAAANYRALGRDQDARGIILWGLVATAVVFALAMVLPDRFPNVVLPLTYCLVVRYLAKIRFGALVDAHRAAHGKIQSWWGVVGVGLLSLIIIGLVFTGLVFALAYLGLIE